ASERAGKREASSARDPERADGSYQLPFVRHGLEHRRTASPTLFSARVAQDLKQGGGVVFAGHLPSEPAQRFAFTRALDVGQLDEEGGGMGGEGGVDGGLVGVSEHDASRDAVAACRDQRVDQWLGRDDRGSVVWAARQRG